MVPIPFPAGLYGDADWAFTHQDLPDALLKQILIDARTAVLQELRRSYFNAVEVNSIEGYLGYHSGSNGSATITRSPIPTTGRLSS